MATIEQLKDALVRADQAGDYEAANLFAADIKKMQAAGGKGPQPELDPVAGLPGGEVPFDKKPELSMVDRLLGVLETGATLGTGLTTGTLTGIGGALKGLGQTIAQGQFGTPEGAQNIFHAFEEGAQKGTYLPRTEAGAAFAQATGEALAPLQALPLPGTFGPAGALLSARPGATALAGGVAENFQSAITRPVRDLITAEGPARRAANVEPALIRQAGLADIDFAAGADSASAARIGDFEAHLNTARSANEVGIKLTEGRIKKDPLLIKREDELLRTAAGKPLRENIVNNLNAVQGKLSQMIEDSGAQNISNRDFGQAFLERFSSAKKARKDAVDAAYRAADEAADANVNLLEFDDVVNALNEGASRSNLKKIRRDVYEVLDASGLVAGGNKARRTGSLAAAGRTSFRDSERIRQELNELITPNATDPADRRANNYIKSVITAIDKAQEKASADVPNPYLPARELYKQYADDFRSTKLLRDLTETKGDTATRKVAAEKVADKILYKADNAEFNHIVDVLERSGDEGLGILDDLKAAAINRVRTKAESRTGVAGDTNQISLYQLSKNIEDLRDGGRLEKLFSPGEAADLDLLENVAKDAFKIYDKTVNFSGTAGALQEQIQAIGEAILNTKYPGAGVAKRAIESRAIKKEVDKALNYSDALEALQRRREGGAQPR